MKNRKAENEAAAMSFLDLHRPLPLPSIFTMGMEGQQIAGHRQIFVVCCMRLFALFTERKMRDNYFVAKQNNNKNVLTSCPVNVA